MCKCKNCCIETVILILVLAGLLFFAWTVLIKTHPSSSSYVSTEQVSIQENYSQNSDACNKNSNKQEQAIKIDITRNVNLYPILCIVFIISLTAVLIFLIWVLSKDDSSIRYSKLEMLEKLKDNTPCCFKCSRMESHKTYKVTCNKCFNDKPATKTTESQICAGKDLLKHYMTSIAEV